MLDEYRREVKGIGLNYQNISWAIVTHFHVDHAGLITGMVADGVNCIVFENQTESVDSMEKTIWKNNKSYRVIDRSKLITWQISNLRASFEKIGISGEVLRTDGHSPDNVGFLTDGKQVIIGDLCPMTRKATRAGN